MNLYNSCSKLRLWVVLPRAENAAPDLQGMGQIWPASFVAGPRKAWLAGS